MGPNSFVGEMAVLTKSRTRSASVQAASKVLAIVMTAPSLQQLALERPTVQVHLKQLLAQRRSNRRMMEAVEALADLYQPCRWGGGAEGWPREAAWVGVREQRQAWV